MPDNAFLPAYKPTSISKEASEFFNTVSVRQSPWEFSLGTAACQAELLSSTPEFSQACTVEVSINGLPCVLELSDAQFVLCHSAFEQDPSLDGQASTMDFQLPDEVRTALVHALLSPLLQQLQKLFGIPFMITSVSFDRTESKNNALAVLGFRISPSHAVFKEAFFARIAFLDARTLSFLIPCMNALPLRKEGFLSGNIPGVPLEVCFEAGYVFLNADAASNLQAGDVLMPDTWTPPATIRALFWQGSSACKIMECSFSEGKATISTCLTESDDMENIANELEIRLSFELERRMISIADLETLSPGYVFDLECDAQSPVTVRANGKPIALGRIVDINGTIGVQLTQKL